MGMVTGSGNSAIHQLFSYDSSGNVVSVDYSSNGGSTFTTYYYLRNAQNDIVKIIDGNGATVVEYKYDSWDKILSTTGSMASTLGANQPFRYRGYVYDTETGWYYLQSRYYDPSIGRFISADVYLSTGQGVLGHNSYAYCLNNPVNMGDPTGTLSFWEKIGIGVAAVLIGAVVVAATAATGGALAAFAGAAVAGLKAAAISGAVGAAVGAGTNAIKHRVSTGSWEGADKAAVNGAVDGLASGFMTGGIMAGASQVVSSGFKIAANAGIPTGRNGGFPIGNKLRVLSPNHPQGYEAGGTLLKIGSKYKNIRFDVGIKSMFHINIQLAKNMNYHIPLGIFGSGMLGGITLD